MAELREFEGSVRGRIVASGVTRGEGKKSVQFNFEFESEEWWNEETQSWVAVDASKGKPVNRGGINLVKTDGSINERNVALLAKALGWTPGDLQYLQSDLSNIRVVGLVKEDWYNEKVSWKIDSIANGNDGPILFGVKKSDANTLNDLSNLLSSAFRSLGVKPEAPAMVPASEATAAPAASAGPSVAGPAAQSEVADDDIPF